MPSQQAVNHCQQEDGADDNHSDSRVPRPGRHAQYGACRRRVLGVRDRHEMINSPTDVASAGSRRGGTLSRKVRVGEANKAREKAEPTSNARKCPPINDLGLSAPSEYPK